MSKRYLSIAAASLAGLASCFSPPPEPPPHRFRQHRPPAPEPLAPDSYQTYPSPYQAPPAPTPPEPAPPTATGGYPTARPTEDPDQVISPYDPFNVIDVAGFKSGQLVRDPSNRKIFRVP